MGKGDKKSKRGKIIMGSFGVSRKKKKKARKYTPDVKPKAKNEDVVEEGKKEAPKKKTTRKTTAKKEAPKKTTTKKTTAKKTTAAKDKKVEEPKAKSEGQDAKVEEKE